MTVRRRLLLCLLLGLAPLTMAARQPHKARPRARAHVKAPKTPSVDPAGLVHWDRQPFSDLNSHGVLVRQPQGLLSWRLRSATAFGSLAAQPNPAKALLDLRLDFMVEGETQPRFAAQAVSLSSYPTWSEESGDDGPLHGDAVTVFAGEDLVVAAVNVKNTGPKALRVRPRLRVFRRGEGLSAQVQQRNSEPQWLFTLDRSAAVGRRLVDNVLLRLGGQGGRAAWLLPGQVKPLAVGPAETLTAGQPLELELTWPVSQWMAPGQTLRVPVLLAWGEDAEGLQAQAAKQWRDSALPVGKAWAAAKARWAHTLSHLPKTDAAHQRLLVRACLDLLLSDYAPRKSLNSDAFSAQKGVRDAFYSIDSPLAALGWSDLDMGRAQASLLDLVSFSAAAPAPVPPYTGEEKLNWEAAGLPLHALAAWELYHRDPNVTRAGEFLSHFGERLRNECAWWPGARDGDKNGLYAFARDEEMPPYLRRLQPGSPVLLNQPEGAPSPLSPVPSLQTWSLALSSLVAWQMQAASALASAAGAQEEAQRWLDQSLLSRHALQAAAWDPATQDYRQGLDAMWMLLLGLEDDAQRRQTWFDKDLLPALSTGEKPWVEQGVNTPWRYYFLARTLAAYGYFDLERELTGRFLDEMDKKPAFDYAYTDDPSKIVGGSVATASVISQLILDRQEQDVYLTENTGEFKAPMVQFRTIDGNFYMKRNRLPDDHEKYADISVETPKHGKILAENSFIFSAPETLALQIQSEWPMDIVDLNRKGALIFKQSRKVELLVRPKTRIQVKFYPPTEAK